MPHAKNPEQWFRCPGFSNVGEISVAYDSAAFERALTFLVSREIFLEALFLWMIPFEPALQMVFIAF
jgi:hypothetical protein